MLQLSPHDKFEVISLWLAALGIFGVAFAAPKWLRAPMMLVAAALASYGTMAFLSSPEEVNKKASDLFDRFTATSPSPATPTPVSKPASPTPTPSPPPTPSPTPSPRPSPSPSPRPKPTPTATTVPEVYYPPDESQKNYDTYDEKPGKWWPFYADFINKADAPLAIEYLYQGEWIQVDLSPNTISSIDSDDAIIQIRLCECQDRDAAKALWRVQALQTDRETGEPFEFYVNWKGKVDLRGGRPK